MHRRDAEIETLFPTKTTSSPSPEAASRLASIRASEQQALASKSLDILNPQGQQFDPITGLQIDPDPIPLPNDYFKQAPAPQRPVFDADRMTSEETFQVPFKDLVEGLGMRKGGMVYASNGMLVPYRPQGTDTVPAMLTPGEFVVNRNATSQYLPVLRAINSGYNTHGQMVNHLARGGVAGSPQYLQNGGLTGLAGSIMNNGVSVNSQIGGLEELKIVVNQLNEAISSGTENMTSVATQISNTSQSLASGAQSLNEAGTSIPTQITQQQRLTVDHAGIPQNIGAEFGRAADYAIGQADSRSAQQLNDLNTANEGSLGLPPPNNNSTIR